MAPPSASAASIEAIPIAISHYAEDGWNRFRSSAGPFNGDWARGEEQGHKSPAEKIALLCQVFCNLYVQKLSPDFNVDVDHGCFPSTMSLILRRPEKLSIYEIKCGTKLVKITPVEAGPEKSLYLPDGGMPIILHLGKLCADFFEDPHPTPE